MTKRFPQPLVFPLLFAIAMLATGLCPAVEPTADFYVSPGGCDTWSGTLSESNGLRTDGPFATLQRARDAVRESGTNRSGDVVVLIRGGTYRLNKTVVFGVKDLREVIRPSPMLLIPARLPSSVRAKRSRSGKHWPTVLPGLPKEATRQGAGGGCDRTVSCTLRCGRNVAASQVGGFHSACRRESRPSCIFPRAD